MENLKSDVLPEQDAGMLIWNTEDKDIYYQGKGELQPPVSVAITYLLDGKETDAIDLNGKSGHLSVHVALKNNESRQIAIAGNNALFSLPFFTVAAAMLPRRFLYQHHRRARYRTDGFQNQPGLLSGHARRL